MAKIVWKTTPKASYEWVEVEGGGSMTGAELKAYLDEYIVENGLVPVESDFVGEVPRHRYGRYKAGGTPAAALAPVATGGHAEDLAKAHSENDDLKVQLARALDQLGKLPKGKRAGVINGPGENDGSVPVSGGGQTTEEARATLNQQDRVNLVGGSEEVRQDMSTADRSDDNPVKRGRPPKDS